MKLEELINYGIKRLKENDIDDSNLIAKKLMGKLLDITNVQIVIKGKDEIDENIETKYKNLIEEIILGKPLQYITNEQYFYGLKFYVDENVLIPQPDTEILVEEAISLFKSKENLKILDICTGSGCIGITLAKKIKNASVTLSDISDSALEIARKNANKNDAKVKIIKSNMFENIEEKYDLIVSNPPYIETKIVKTLNKQVQNEPIIALDGGKDGLDFYKILANNSYKYLKDNGYLLMEIGYNQKEEVSKILKETNKYENIYCKKDLSENDRLIVSKLGKE